MKILYFYPENPLLLNQGNNARANSLLQYFKERKIEVDFVGVQADNFSHKDIQELIKIELISTGHLLHPFKRKTNRLKYLFLVSIPNKFSKTYRFLNRIRPNQITQFNAFLQRSSYSHIIISYAYWAGLVIDNPNIKKAKICIDTHDFLTSQFQNAKGFQLGSYFQKEIEILSTFDEIFVISTEENYIFSQFLKSKVTTLSHFLKNNFVTHTKEKKFDVVYIASNNVHNIAAAKWFFDEVFPLISKQIQIVVIGRIGKYISNYDNVTKIEYAANSFDFYSQSRLAICPMLSGTGLKIKVIEALSYGLPVICNERGADGLTNKTNNGCLVTNNPKEFADYITSLLNNDEFYLKISEQAKEYFLENNDLASGYKKLDIIFNDVK